MTRSWKLLTLNNKQLARAAVVITAAALGFACSSSSSGQPFNGDDATTGGDAGGASGDVTAPSEPCDAAIVLPTGGATGAACGECLMAHCASDLATCQMTNCQCVTAIECLAANQDNYTMCPDALPAIGAGNVGLTALAKCIVDSCTVCNDAPD